MTVEVEVTHQGYVDAHGSEAVADVRHCRGGAFFVHRDTDQFAAGTGQRRHLRDGGFDVSRVRVGHRLHDDGGAAADGDATNTGLQAAAARG